jgi:hypothetical protein
MEIIVRYYTISQWMLMAGAAFLFQNADALPNRYNCYQTHEDIVIDGVLSEPAWLSADNINFRENIRDTIPRKQTRAWALWDSANFYIGMIAYTESVIGTLTKRDENIWAYDCLEIMYDPDSDSLNYTELEWNCLNTLFDEFWKAPLSGGNLGYTAAGLMSKVTVQGSANKPSDIDTSWTLEISIPWTTIDTGSKISLPPKDNDSIRINLFREDYSPYQLSAFSPTMAGSFHVLKKFGVFKFIEKRSTLLAGASLQLHRATRTKSRMTNSKIYDTCGRLIPTRNNGAGVHTERRVVCCSMGKSVVIKWHE